MKILVTGGAGFIGSHLVELFVEQGYRVRVLDNLSTGRLENLSRVIELIEFVRGDLRDPQTVDEAVKGIDTVVHLAAKINVEESLSKPELYWQVNVEGTRNVLEAMAKRGVGRIVFMSSAAVYGNPKYIPISEDHPLQPINPYGETKLEGERLIEAYSAKHGFKGIIIRLFNAYGPRQEGNPYAGVVQKFIEKASRREPPVIFGDGLQTRDFIYVKDVAGAILHVMERARNSGVYNLGTGVETRIIDLAYMILDLFELRNLKPVHTDPRPGDVRRSVADIRRLKSLGWSPKYTLREGLREMISLIRGGKL